MTFTRSATLAAAAAAAALGACAGARPPATAAPAPAPAPVPDEFFLDVDGGAGKLRVSVGGTGEPAVVLVHGLGSDLEVWRAQLDHLRVAHRAIAYDQRGHGGSDRAAAGAYTIDALAADLDAVAQALRLERFILVGHSLSGEVVTAYAGAHPEKIAGLVYVDAVGDLAAVPPEALQRDLDKEAGNGPAEWRREFAEMLGPRARPATREAVLAALARADPAAIGALRRDMVRFDARARRGSARAPSLAIEAAGSDSTVLASKVLAVPRVEIAGVSHWLQLDDPAATNRALDAFLATVH